MDQGSPQNGAPDSWEQNDVGGVGDVSEDKVSEPMSSLTLNVHATEFVPGRNVNAAEFIPSFPQSDGSNSQPQVSAEETPNETETSSAVEEDMPPDDWADKDENGDSGGSEDVMDTDDVEEKPAAMAPKSTEEIVKKDHVNVVFIGHVDAGKSTIGGHIMFLTGQVDKRTLEKYEREAKEKNRETWYLSWALDTNPEERDKGKTVEVGRAKFETEDKHFTILDAPGHKSFVPNMIAGVSQADLAVLVISARKGEFETGFERGGQTREHALIAKTGGVRHLIVLVNKMDDPTVQWSETRYEEVKNKLTPYLKKLGFNPKTDITYMPASGLSGAFLKEPASTTVCPWYRGPCFLDYLNCLPSFNRPRDSALRIPIVDKYKDMGVIVLGKVESGTVVKGQTYTLMPNRIPVEVLHILSDEDDTNFAYSGENVKVKLKGVEEDDVSPGFVLCSSDSLCNTGMVFDAQIVILETKSIMCAGYSAVLHLHTVVEDVTLQDIICIIDKKTGVKSRKVRFLKQDQIAIVRFKVVDGLVCMETFKEFPQLGRFSLRDESRTIAIGKVLKIRD